MWYNEKFFWKNTSELRKMALQKEGLSKDSTKMIYIFYIKGLMNKKCEERGPKIKRGGKNMVPL